VTSRRRPLPPRPHPRRRRRRPRPTRSRPTRSRPGVGKALAAATSLEIARTSFGSPPGGKRTETDAAKLAAFAAAIGDAPLGNALRKCPDTIVVTARGADGAVVAELGFCGTGADLTEGAEATLPGRPRGRLTLADAAAVGALLAP
jgi:hypothetical protein